MKLIEDDYEGVVSYWISKEPKTNLEVDGKKIAVCGVGLKALINFNTREIELIEEDAKERQYNSILMSFGEFRNLQTIMKDRE